MAADMKLAVDKVIVNAQWHVHGYGNISSIKGKTSKSHRKCHLFYIYIIYKAKGLQITVNNR
jgi:hypothetical protein